MNLIFLGPLGAGKGDSRYEIDDHCRLNISTGRVSAREEMKKGFHRIKANLPNSILKKASWYRIA